MSTVLVTGGTGYLGSELVRQLRAQGCSVVVLAEAHSTWRWPDDAGIIRCAYDGDMASVQQAFDRHTPTQVFHLATRFLAQHTPEDIAPLMAANLTFGTQVLEAMVASGVKDIVNVGTSWQTMDGSACRPANLYAATKQAFADVLDYYADAHSLNAVTVHLFDTYGPRDPRGKVVSRLIRALRQGEALALSPGEQVLDLLHVHDVIGGLLAAATLAGDLRNVALRSGESLSLRALVTRIEALAGRPLAARWGERPYRPREIMQPLSPHPTLPGWAPTVALDTGLAELLAEAP